MTTHTTPTAGRQPRRTHRRALFTVSVAALALTASALALGCNVSPDNLSPSTATSSTPPTSCSPAASYNELLQCRLLRMSDDGYLHRVLSPSEATELVAHMQRLGILRRAYRRGEIEQATLDAEMHDLDDLSLRLTGLPIDALLSLQVSP